MVKRRISKWRGTYFLSRATSHGVVGLIGRNVSVMDMTTRERLSVGYPLSHPSSYDVSPDGRYMAVKSTSGQIVIIDPRTGFTIKNFGNHKEGEGSNLCFSPDGKYIVDGSWNGVISIRSLCDTQPTYREEYWEEMISSISHDQQRQLWMVRHTPKAANHNHAHCGGYVALRRWPIQTSPQTVFGFDMDIYHACLSPDGSRIAFYGIDFKGDQAQRLYISSSVDGRILVRSSEITTGGTGRHLAWSEDCHYIVATSGKEFQIFETDRLRRIKAIFSKYPACSTFIDGGETIVLGDWSQTTLSKFSDLISASNDS